MNETGSKLITGASLGGMAWFAVANPAIGIPLLLSMGPAALSQLFSQSPKVLQDKISELLKPENVAAVTNQFYQQGLGSPAYSQAQANIAQGANQTANTLAASLASRGIGTTGTGAILNSLTPSIVGSQQSALQSKLYGEAQTAALQNIKDRIAQLQGIANAGPSQTMQLLGTGIDALNPIVQQYLKGKYPDTYGDKNTNKGGGTTQTGITHGQEGISVDPWTPVGRDNRIIKV